MLPSPRQQTAWTEALSLLGGVGFSIAIPMVLFAIIGHALDRRWNTAPWLLLTGIFLALLFSSFVVMRKVLHMINTLDKKSTSADSQNPLPHKDQKSHNTKD